MYFPVVSIGLQLSLLVLAIETRLSPKDPHSYSRPDQFKTTHIHWEFDVNFEEKVLKGYVILSLEKVHEKGASNITSVLLDGKSLNIKEVIDLSCNCELDYKYELRLKVLHEYCKKLKILII